MVHIPIELQEQAARGNVILFLGDRVLRDSQGGIVVEQWATELAHRCGIDEVRRYTFPDIAQAYEDMAGRHALIQFVRERMAAVGDAPQPLHRLLAGYGAVPGAALHPVLVTTGIDRRLEQAFRERQRPLDVIVGRVDVAFEDEQHARLYKLRGSIEQVESLVLTRDDAETFFEQRASISIVLQAYLARKTVLFIGYDLSDSYFQRLYRKVTGTLDSHARRSYALFPEQPPLVVSGWCERRGISSIIAEEHAFLQALSNHVAAQAASRPAAGGAAALPLPRHPYKLLDYYEPDDAAIFFGRQQETRMLAALIHAHRLVLLHGASGVGKTSLLLAGVLPRLANADPPCTWLYVRLLHEPLRNLARTLERTLQQPVSGSLLDMVQMAVAHLGHTLILVFDQFEEFFTRFSPPLRAAFIDELAALHAARDLPVKLVIGLREDYLAAMSELEQRIPDIFTTRMRLLPLDHAQAHQAITAPAERLGIFYDADLLDRLLVDLMGRPLADTFQHGEASLGAVVMPPQMQLVCSALYQGLGPGERLITPAIYDRLGGTRGILQQYLRDELERFDYAGRLLAHRVLAELVTSQNSRAIKSAEELALLLDLTPAALAAVLEKLLHARLLRSLEGADGMRCYELAHDYLIRNIEHGSEVQRRKQVEELIAQEVENWQRLGMLMGRDRLVLVNEVRDELRLTPDAQELLMRSALHWGYEVVYWLSRVSDPQRRVALLTEADEHELPTVLLRSATLVGAPGVHADTVPQLAEVLVRWLSDSDWRVRASAARALQHLGALGADIAALVTGALLGRLKDIYWEVRCNVVAALGVIASADDARVLQVRQPLIACLADEDEQVRAAAVEALAQGGISQPALADVHLLNVLLGCLHDAAWRVRASAAQALEQLVPRSVEGARHTAEALMGMLESSSAAHEVREGVVLALGGVGMALALHHPQQGASLLARMLPLLAARLTSDDHDVRSHAVVALGQLGAANHAAAQQSMPLLLERLTDAHSFVRTSAASALGDVSTQSSEIAHHLVRELQGKLSAPDSHMREWAIIALERVGEVYAGVLPALVAQVVEMLLARLADAAWQVRARAVVVLAHLITAGADEQSDPLPPETITHAVAALLQRLHDEHEIVATSAITALGDIAQRQAHLPGLLPPLVAALMERLQSHNRAIRVSATLVLGEIACATPAQAPTIVAALLERLTDPESYVRVRAAGVLARVYAAQARHTWQQGGDGAALLFERLTTSERRSERLVAARALFLAALHTPEYAPVIRARLEALAASSQQSTRLWVNITLQMLEIGDMAQAARGDARLYETLYAKLEQFKSADFFDADMNWAMREALAWLEEQSGQG